MDHLGQSINVILLILFAFSTPCMYRPQHKSRLDDDFSDTNGTWVLSLNKIHLPKNCVP